MYWDPDPATQHRATTPDGAQNTEPPDGAQNTGTGQAPQPHSGGVSKEERQAWIDQGYKIGLERALKKLGLPMDLGEASEQLQTLRNPSQPEPTPAAAPSSEDLAKHPQYVELAQRSSKLERDLKALEKEKQGFLSQIESFRAQADVARVEKLKAMALAKGVGPGKQVEAFVRLYGDSVQFNDARDLVVLSRYPDGSLGPSGQTVEEFIDEALSDARFLLVPEGRSGSGSKQQPVRPESKPADVEARDELLQQLGVGHKANSKLDRVFSQALGESK